MAGMQIGELARRAATPVATIRHYEREGLLAPPPRTEGDYRVYGDADLARLTFIRHCRRLDMGLADIRALLALRDNPQADCAAATALLETHLDHVAARLRDLQALQTQLRGLRARCQHNQAAAQCGILAGLAQP